MGLPQIWAGTGTPALPAAISAAASFALDAAAGVVGVAVLDAQVHEAAAERKPRIRRDGPSGAVARGRHPGTHFHAAAVRVVLQHEVHDAGDGVRAVLRRRAVAQDFDALEGDRRYHGQVRALRALRRLGHQPRDDRAAMPPLAIDQHQRVVGRKIAQVRRADDGRAVGDRLRVDAEGRNDRAQGVEQVRVALVPQRRLADDVHWRGRVDVGPIAASGADDDHFLEHVPIVRLRPVCFRVGGALHRQARRRGEPGPWVSLSHACVAKESSYGVGSLPHRS